MLKKNNLESYYYDIDKFIISTSPPLLNSIRSINPYRDNDCSWLSNISDANTYKRLEPHE